MTTDEKWKHFKATAKQQLNFTEQPSFLESFIEFTCEPSFDPIHNLQVIWTDKYVKWRKAKWDMQADYYKFYETDGVAKFITSIPKATVEVKSGTAHYELMTDVVSAIRKLNVQPRIDRQTSFTLDGSTIIFSLGTGDLRTTYSWHTLPEEWSELQQLVDSLLALQSHLEM